jgi:hypothetical protein
MTDKTRMAQRFDSAWSKFDIGIIRSRIQEENEAAKEFDSDFGTDEIIPEQGEKWGNTEGQRP